jgi:hypothetical protein
MFVSMWSWLKGFGKSISTNDPEDPFSSVRWVKATDNPFEVEVLDCSVFSKTMISTTENPEIAEKYAMLRQSTGAEYKDTDPSDFIEISCDLKYRREGETRDGPLFKAQEMDHKWDIYLYGNYLYFARSWSGILVHRARIGFELDCARVTLIRSALELAKEDPAYVVASVDFLIRSHLYGRPVLHPLPRNLGNDPKTLAMFSFSEYGRFGLVGTFADTVKIKPLNEQSM